ncbi:MAG: S8 family serine peptidase [Acidobacteria bacterium]|nr:S8 family serine peptidase [Acidobacteriota bacterium]
MRSRRAIAASFILLLLTVAGTLTVGASRASGALTPPSPAADGQVLVRFRESAGGAAIAATHARLGASITYRSPRTRWQAVSLPAGTDPQAIVRRYRLDPSVEAAEFVRARHIAKKPNDLRLIQWHLNNVGQAVSGVAGTPGADINALKAWDLTTGSLAVTVAVLDTGIDRTRGDLSSRLLPGGMDFINNNIPIDDNGHGTGVASIIGAVGNNGKRLTGVAWKVSLLPIKVCNSLGECPESAINQGIDWAVTHGAHIINMSIACDENPNPSLGCVGIQSGDCFSQAELDAVKSAQDAGVTVVMAAGNCGGNNDDATSSYPCAYDLSGTVCAGATNNLDNRPGFSDFGPQTVDIGAPGADVPIYFVSPPGGTLIADGTSFASPNTAGVAALLLARGPFAPAAVRARIVLGGNHTNNLATQFAGGRLDAFETVKDLFLKGLAYSTDLPGSVNLLADMNNDGEADLIRGGGGGFSVSLAAARSPKFDAAQQWTASLPGTANLTGDVDGDGRADVILGDAANGFQALRSTGTTFLPVESWSGQVPGALSAAGDFDGDNRADVVTFTSDFEVLISAGTAFAAPQSWSSDTAGSFIAAGDVDGDGKDDLINWTPFGTGAHVDVSLSTGTAFGASSLFVNAVALDPNSTLTPVGTSDFDGDGMSDLLAVDSLTHCVMVLRSTGAAFAQARPWACPGAAGVVLAGRVDASKDSRADVLVNVGGASWQMLRSVK